MLVEALRQSAHRVSESVTAKVLPALVQLEVTMPFEMLPPPPPVIIITGLATYYSPGLFARVYANRVAWGHVQVCDDCVSLAAMIDRADVGKRIRVRNVATGETVGPLLVVDCAAPEDIASLRERRIVVEVDWGLAQLWGMTGPIEVEVEVLP